MFIGFILSMPQVKAVNGHWTSTTGQRARAIALSLSLFFSECNRKEYYQTGMLLAHRQDFQERQDSARPLEVNGTNSQIS